MSVTLRSPSGGLISVNDDAVDRFVSLGYSKPSSEPAPEPASKPDPAPRSKHRKGK